QLLLREDLPAEQASKLAVIESQVQRMIETMRSVLGRTRDREIGRGPVALAPLAAEALALVATRLAGREIALRRELAPDLPPGRGARLGLRIVDRIVRAHGGQVVVESIPGRGTTTRVRLPLEA